MDIDIQLALDTEVAPPLPTDEQITCWAGAAFVGAGRYDTAQLTVRIVDEAEITHLNSHYRQKFDSTNVLSFPFEALPGLPVGESESLLGDVVVCAAVVVREAAEQNKSSEAHWAHMIVHGCLHLLGFDHFDEAEAAEMEMLETRILVAQGYPKPYREPEPESNCKYTRSD
jgi:probable rRNA maturation factor